ncbi:hypothetical protein DZF79_15445 [Vibrio parahaemolyticus]|nr:hypothetical protein [Vibrio parahaemolyticus]
MNDTVKTGFSLRNAASYIFRQFNEEFKLRETCRKDDPEGWLGEITLNTEDGKEKLMEVSAKISYEIGFGKGKSSHYKCIFTVKCENHKVKHGVFRTRTLTIKDNTLESKERVIKQIKAYYSELVKLLSDAEDFNNKSKVIAEKNVELVAPELEKIKSSLGDALKDIETVIRNGDTDVSVRINLNNGERIFTSFDGEHFSLMLLNNRRHIKAEKLIAVIDAVI